MITLVAMVLREPTVRTITAAKAPRMGTKGASKSGSKKVLVRAYKEFNL